ncbi:hypothetical protein EJ377_22220 [Chryseobacterium arthrosphaerae]|uniref:Uncharacterized protein n=1 Tax=Chryseobacterium arthrosphaerae TaxID=651561 RepID=A0A432DUE6_9FLAO|nr:hypothetical protein EJ377_22220 [Chryseobacterium arthrosphaerae]
MALSGAEEKGYDEIPLKILNQYEELLAEKGQTSGNIILQISLSFRNGVSVFFSIRVSFDEDLM